jgi:hypothetical protein
MQAADAAWLKSPSAKPSLITAQTFVQTAPAWISQLTGRLMFMSDAVHSLPIQCLAISLMCGPLRYVSDAT